MLNNFDLNKLRPFYWMMRHQRVQAAAKELHVTASAVSQAIRVLESDVGKALFVRSGKRYLATQDAYQLFAHVEPFLLTLDASLQSMKQKQGVAGVLRYGAPPNIGANELIKVVASFHQKHPSIQHRLSLADTQRLYAMVLDNQ